MIGREDNAALSFGRSVPSLESIVRNIRNDFPTVYLYHKPQGLKDAADLGIDLMLSGHVHGGQLFPVRFITNWIYGIGKRDFDLGGMRVFVSDGVGTWGPPVRIGAASEIVEIIM